MHPLSDGPRSDGSLPDAAPAAATNPFATRCTRPGAMAYTFPAGINAAALVDRLAAQGWRGAIVGPHGSGKSTLVVALAAELERRGRRVAAFVLSEGQRRLPDAWRTLPAGPLVVIVDGYEQLSSWSRWRLRLAARGRGWGLLVTSHRPLGLPTLFETRVELETLRELVRQLAPSADQRIGDDDIRAAFAAHAGNAREALFALYDVYEARRPGG
jgi:hypothetical protein